MKEDIFMLFIIVFLALITLGSFGWTIVQIAKPEWFFAVENEANLKKERPGWYFGGGVLGIISIIIIWFYAIRLQLTSVWIFTAILTLGSIKPLGMVFFYEKFSDKASKIVTQMNDSKKTYYTVVILRGVLSLVLLFVTLYFGGFFGEVR